MKSLTKTLLSLGAGLLLVACDSKPTLEGDYQGKHFEWNYGHLRDEINVSEIGKTNYSYSVTYVGGRESENINWREISEDNSVVDKTENIWITPYEVVVNPGQASEKILNSATSTKATEKYAEQALIGIRNIAKEEATKINALEERLIQDLNKEPSVEKN